jgi:RNA polymerase sigma-70 factor (ECF subfamily)
MRTVVQNPVGQAQRLLTVGSTASNLSASNRAFEIRGVHRKREYAMSHRSITAKAFVSCGDLLQQPEWDCLIRRKARSLKRRPCFQRESRDDIENELFSRVWERLRNTAIPGDRPWQFVRQALNCAVCDLIKSADSKKRRFEREAVLLSTRVNGSDGRCMTMHDAVPDRRRSDLDMQIDVRDLLDAAPTSVRGLGLALREATRSEHARDLGVPRSTTYEDLAKLRRVLEPLRPPSATFLAGSVMNEIEERTSVTPEVSANDAS